MLLEKQQLHLVTTSLPLIQQKDKVLGGDRR